MTEPKDISQTPGESVKSPFDLKDTHPEKSVVPDPQQAEMHKQLERGLKDTFPASDPVAVSQPTTTGPAPDENETKVVKISDAKAKKESRAR
jgi:hypothetical protein